MIGGVFGDTTGIAPGYKGSLSWWKLELYSEGEYVFDTGAPRTVSSTTGRSWPWPPLSGSGSAW